ncbi:hypothetical protein fugu_012976 [Takifugu bimaculatus]|uniref:Uncharacterized protein n=1 Tax=Takifugu bimaculatus TaxID=433685 RepID=A0A4Z2C700_9TELE|nr:hypothetical protein fugu_012976 [Takifugu bimaculatus]
MKLRVLVRHNAEGCDARTGRGTFGCRAERYQLKNEALASAAATMTDARQH